MAFLNDYPQITLIENADTAGSARKIRERNAGGVAAIGASSAASLYDLEILASGIETYHLNYTRFLILSRDGAENGSADKASVCFSLDHKPGSLAKLLVKLAEEGINLSKIQSVPKENGGGEYLFYLDLEFPQTHQLTQLLSLLEQNSRGLEVLGIYKKGNTLYDSSNS
jgi:prephenate dehydratase